MKSLVKEFMHAIRSQVTGMAFIRKFGPSPKRGYTSVVVMALVAVPNADAENIPSEWHCPVLGSSATKDVLVLTTSIGEGQDISELSRGCGIEGLLTEPIWRV